VVEPSSTVPVVPTGLPDLAKFSTEERREWLGKGSPFVMPKEADPASAEKPAVEKESKTAESTPAKETSAPTEKPGETAPAPEADLQQGKHPKKGNAEARVAELLAERHELRTRLEALEKGAQKTASPPAAEVLPTEVAGETVEPVEPEYEEPDIETFDTLDAYNAARKAARDKHRVEMADYRAKYRTWLTTETESTVRKQLTEQQLRAEQQQDVQRAKKEHGKDFAALMDFLAENSTQEFQVALSMLGPGRWDSLGLHLAKNPDELKRIGDIFGRNDAAGMAEIGKLEYRLDQEKLKDKKPPVETKPHSKAPDPPIDIAGRNGAPVDERRAALEAGNFERYRDIENARELKKRT